MYLKRKEIENLYVFSRDLGISILDKSTISEKIKITSRISFSYLIFTVVVIRQFQN